MLLDYEKLPPLHYDARTHEIANLSGFPVSEVYRLLWLDWCDGTNGDALDFWLAHAPTEAVAAWVKAVSSGDTINAPH